MVYVAVPRNFAGPFNPIPSNRIAPPRVLRSFDQLVELVQDTPIPHAGGPRFRDMSYYTDAWSVYQFNLEDPSTQYIYVKVLRTWCKCYTVEEWQSFSSEEIEHELLRHVGRVGLPSARTSHAA